MELQENTVDTPRESLRMSAALEARIEKDFRPISASEDFAFMLQEKPGSYLFLGNGDSAPLHSPLYNFNDEILPSAARYWVKLTETYLARNPSDRPI